MKGKEYYKETSTPFMDVSFWTLQSKNFNKGDVLVNKGDVLELVEILL
jgi:hypothetical protein